MVVEKPVLVALGDDARVTGCSIDEERRRFSSALARRRDRFAFPDDFVAAVRKLAEHVIAKHSKDSDLGKFLRRLTDFRAECADWETAAPEVLLLFVFATHVDVPDDADAQIDALIKRFRPTGVFGAVRGQAVSLDTMTAARHLASDALDLDFLSVPARPVR